VGGLVDGWVSDTTCTCTINTSTNTSTASATSTARPVSITSGTSWSTSSRTFRKPFLFLLFLRHYRSCTQAKHDLKAVHAAEMATRGTAEKTEARALLREHSEKRTEEVAARKVRHNEQLEVEATWVQVSE
jgi:hypothetical protein